MYLVFRSTNCSIIDTFPTVQALTCAQVQGLLRPASAAYWMNTKLPLMCRQARRSPFVQPPHHMTK